MFSNGQNTVDLEQLRFKGNVEKLIEIAQNREENQRTEALRQLGLMHTDRVIPVAIQLFRDPDPAIQKAASQTLSKLGTSAVPSLIRAYRTKSEHVIKWIDTTLLSIGSDAADILINTLPKLDELSQERVSYILVSMGSSILPKLVNALGLHDGDGERIVESIIENIGSPSIPHLITALSSPDNDICSLAATELILAGPGVVPAILQSCADSTPEERDLKYYIIAQIGTPALDALYEGLKNPDPVIAAMAVEAFVEFGDSAITPLIAGLFEQDPDTQQSAENAIIRIGEPIVNRLIMEIPSRNGTEQERIVRLLTKIGQPALPIMVEALQNPSLEVSKHMITGVASMGAIATPLLLEKIDSSDQEALKNINKVFKLIGKSCLPSLEDAVVQPNERIATFALGMLKDIDPIWAIDPLVTSLHHSSEKIRNKAISCLLEIGDLAVPRLITLLASEDAELVNIAKKTIIEIGESAAPHLVDAYGDPYGSPEELITEILQQIGSVSLEYVVQLLSEEPPRLDIGREYLMDMGFNAIPAVLSVFDSANTYTTEQGRKMLADLYEQNPPGYIYEIPRIQSAHIEEAYTPIISEPGSLPTLLVMLTSDDEREEFFARGIIERKGDQIVPALISSLRKADEKRIQTISTLLAAYGDSVVDALVLALRDPDLQPAAAVTLGKIPSSVPKLLPLLSERSNNIAYYAGTAIAHTGKDAAPILIENFQDDSDPDVLARILSDIGITAMPPLISALSELNATGHGGTRRSVGLMECLVTLALADEKQMHVLFGLTDKALIRFIATIMIREGERVLDPLISALMSWKGETPVLIYDIFSSMKNEAAQRLHNAIASIPSGDERKIPILQLLGSLRNPSSSAFLLECLNDPSAEIRLAAVREMGKFGKDALKPLQKASKDESLAVRAAAISAMGDVGLPALDSLITVLREPETPIRTAAIEGIAKIGEPAKIMLVQVLIDRDRDVRKNVVHLLGKIGWKPKYTIDKLDYLFASEDWDSLVKMGPSAMDVLERGLKDDNEEIRVKSEECLKQIQSNLSAGRMGRDQ